MPGVLDAGTSDPGSSSRVKAESIKLWLPFQLDSEDRDSICLGGVVNSEKELRFAQLEDALNDLRRTRRIRHGLLLFHKVQLSGEGQKTQTRSRGVVQTINDRIAKCARRYRAARCALLCLDPQGDWKKLYLDLSEADNRGPGKECEEKSASDGRYTLSWIWRSSTTSISPDEVNEDMRVEWAQCVARADRWEEEVTLLQEEMRRVVAFLEWRSSDWVARVALRTDVTTPAVRTGLSAYANKQGSIFHNLAVRFARRWRSALKSLSLPYAWATKFLEPLDIPDPKQTESPPVAHACAASLPPVTTSLPPITASTDTSVSLPPIAASVDTIPSLPPIAASADVIPPPPTALETIGYRAQVSDVDSDELDSDEVSSECDGSEYNSASSWVE
jgi:hypothetical protein